MKDKKTPQGSLQSQPSPIKSNPLEPWKNVKPFPIAAEERAKNIE